MEALDRDERRAEYQPIVGTATGRLVGVEALLRWVHPSQGVIGPGTVIPMAEQAGLIGAFGHWVLRQACLDRPRWPAESGSYLLDLAVNVSAVQLMDAGYVSSIENVMTSTGTTPATVTLEVTESVFIQDSNRALAVLHDLKDLGVMLALDDFGTGYSSLSYLKKFPVDIVKIDQVFIGDLTIDPTSRLIVSAVVSLAHFLDMQVVAEGVETAEQRAEVLALECDYFQGFLTSQPLPPDRLSLFMDEVSRGRELRQPALGEAV